MIRIFGVLVEVSIKRCDSYSLPSDGDENRTVSIIGFLEGGFDEEKQQITLKMK